MTSRAPQSAFGARRAGIFSAVPLVVLFALGIFARPLPARTLIEEALEAGVLDAETAALYQVYSVRDLSALPEEFRQLSDHPYCATPVLTAARQAGLQLSREGRERLAKALARPDLERKTLSPSGRFQIHFTLEGRNRVDAADLSGNGHGVGRELFEAFRQNVGLASNGAAVMV